MLISIAILAMSLAALVFWLFAFAHGQVLSADVRELERLHEEGLLPATNSLEVDFETLTSLLKAIGPAVYMRQAPWIRAYFHTLRFSRLFWNGSARLETELRRLVALQCCNYRRACVALSEYSAE